MLVSPRATEQGAHAKVLRAVASFEMAKGMAGLLAAFSVLMLIHKDPWDIADSILSFLHINPDRRMAQMLLDWADKITDRELWWLSGVAFCYSALRFIEAYGLWKARVWAEWVALVSGALYLPFEVHALVRHPTWFHVAVLAGNVAIVLYMAYLRISSKRRRAHAISDHELTSPV